MKSVVVNGNPSMIKYQQCSRCVQDSTVPGIVFDENKVCNFCHLHDKMEKVFPNGDEGEAIMAGFVEKNETSGGK